KGIQKCRNESLKLWELLRVEDGFKYTINHDSVVHPAATLYGTWSAVNARCLVLGESREGDSEHGFISEALLKHRLADGTFLPEAIATVRTSKSTEYLKLHCYN